MQLFIENFIYSTNQSTMKLTYYGHACFLVETTDKKLLFDPFITPNELASDIDVEQVEADYILVTHGHQDHVADAVSIAKRTEAQVISNFEIINWFAKQGVENGYPMNHGGNASFDFGKVKYVNAVHSSVLPDGTYGGNPGGFIVYADDKQFYFAGDTALTLDMQLIPRFAQLDLAILPIGDNFTMGPEDAVIAADFIQCDRVMGVHYDTFLPIKIDHELAKKAFANAGKELLLVEVGDVMEF
jgi:L-ascorbate metabolism protein UlaG (beta-lactamase superfamily)